MSDGHGLNGHHVSGFIKDKISSKNIFNKLYRLLVGLVWKNPRNQLK